MHTVTTKLATLGAVALLSLGWLCRPAAAADFYAVFRNYNNASHPTAQFDVSIDPGPAAGGPTIVFFDVYQGTDGTPLDFFTVDTNTNGFASSSSALPPDNNLFTITGGLPALVRATTATGFLAANAVLRLNLQGSKFVTAVPPWSAHV